MDVLCNPRLSVCTEEHTLVSEVVLDGELYENIFITDALSPCENLHRLMEYLHSVEQLLSSSLTECKITILQKHTTTILQISAFLLHGMYTDTSGGNKQMYIAD